ncbi:hypothetical protein LINPERPRIM_LOCUS3173 [Linum perenne]
MVVCFSNFEQLPDFSPCLKANNIQLFKFYDCKFSVSWIVRTRFKVSTTRKGFLNMSI